jgi:hypothetical protein
MIFSSNAVQDLDHIANRVTLMPIVEVLLDHIDPEGNQSPMQQLLSEIEARSRYPPALR